MRDGYVWKSVVFCVLLSVSTVAFAGLDPWIDIDIDSDNTKGLGHPERTRYEDSIEDIDGDYNKPGKLVFANDGDINTNDVPNYADGLNKWDNARTNAGGFFTPLIIELNDTPYEGDLFIRLTYDDSDPAKIIRTGGGNPNSPYHYKPQKGAIRIWTKDGDESRRVEDVNNNGDFIKNKGEYRVSDLSGNYTKIFLYVEGIEPSDDVASCDILAECSEDEGSNWNVDSDTVRCTVVGVDLDADFNDDQVVNAADPDDPEESDAPGVCVPLNGDRDAGVNYTAPDYQVPTVVTENDMVLFHVDLKPRPLRMGTVTLGVEGDADSAGASIFAFGPPKTHSLMYINSTNGATREKTWELPRDGLFAQLSRDLYVEGIDRSRTYGDLKVFLRYTTPDGLSKTDTVALYVPGALLSHNHEDYDANELDGTAEDVEELGYGTHKGKDITEAEVIAALPTKLVWYNFGHGCTNTAGKFIGPGFEEFWGGARSTLHPWEVPEEADYDLVFINSCGSATSGSLSGALMKALKAETYVGWNVGKLNAHFANAFGTQFMEKLDEGLSVAEAVYEGSLDDNDRRPKGRLYHYVENHLEVWGNSGLVVDLLE